jgi:CheY-like chemotaxis protein
MPAIDGETDKSAATRDFRPPVVLVVDDEAPLLRALQRVLRRHFEVLAAGNAAEARAVAGVRQLDLILADYLMPGEDGVTCIRRLRELGHDAPALIVSASPGAEVRAAVREGLVAGVVEKPWDSVELLTTALRLAGRPPSVQGACTG